MRPFRLQLLAFALAFAFSGGAPLALAWSLGDDDPVHCTEPSHACCGESLTRCGCADEADDLPASLPSRTAHSSVSKAQSRDTAFVPARVALVSVPLALELRARTPHRLARSLSLPILHAALLL